MTFKLLPDFQKISEEEKIEILYRYLVKGESGSEIAKTYYNNKNYAWKVSATTQGYAEVKGVNRGAISATKSQILEFVKKYPNGTYNIPLTLNEWLIKHSSMESIDKSDDGFIEIFHSLRRMVEEEEIRKSEDLEIKRKNKLNEIKLSLRDIPDTPFRTNYPRPLKLSKGMQKDEYENLISNLFIDRSVIYKIEGVSYEFRPNYIPYVTILFFFDFLYIIEVPFFSDFYNQGLRSDVEPYDKIIFYKDLPNKRESYINFYTKLTENLNDGTFYERTRCNISGVLDFWLEEDIEIKEIVNLIIKNFKGE